MAQLSKVSSLVEIKSPADKFFGCFKEKLPDLPRLVPEYYLGFKILEGNGICDGATIWLEYYFGGNKATAIEKVEVNESSKIVNLIVIEGNILEACHSCKLTFKVNDNGYVKIGIESEKKLENAPDPGVLISVLKVVIQKLDAHCSSN